MYLTVLVICLLYTFLQRNLIFKLIYAGTFSISCGLFSNVIEFNYLVRLFQQVFSKVAENAGTQKLQTV